MIPISPGASCPRAILCDYITTVETKDVNVTVCQLCGKKQIYHVRNGRVDNKKFYEDHLRDFLQPYGAQKELYIRVYGTSDLKKMQEHLEKKREVSKTDIHKGARDYHQMLRENRATFS